MSTEPLPDGPDLDEMLQLIRDAFPDAVVARIDSAAFFSLDEKHWPNFATIVWTMSTTTGRHRTSPGMACTASTWEWTERRSSAWSVA